MGVGIPVVYDEDGRPNLTHYWRLRRWLPERHAHPCRIIARGRGPGPRNILVEFTDGLRVSTARWSVRLLAHARD